MPDGTSAPPKWTLATGIAECQREQQSRGRTYPTLIAREAMTEAEAVSQNLALDGTLRFLLWCQKYEPELREFMAAKMKETAAP